MNERKKPDWESFETYKGPEEKMPGWMDGLIHRIMTMVLYLLVFGAAGALAFLIPYRVASNLVVNESMVAAAVRFCFGGLLGVLWIRRMMRHRRVGGGE